MDVGYILVLLGALSSAYATYSFFLGARSDGKRALKLLSRAETSTILSALFFFLSFLTLTYYFIVHDFSYYYVYRYSDTKLSLEYLISAVWAGREGSLLLWVVYIAILNVVALKVDSKDRVLALTLAITNCFIFALSLLLLTVSNPFVKLDFSPPEGYGLNPLLRTPEMALHPPTIFLGYAAGIFPFAYAVASVQLRERWEKRVRFWTLVTWIFLSIGIFLGGWWAYKTLGWGGFWAWDPVENASLLPWISATALLHGIMRKRFEALNYYLALSTAALIVLATFITRSGIIESVHAFGKNPEGPIYLLYIALLIAIGTIVERRVKLSANVDVSQLKDTTIFAEIVILLLSLVTILLGTLAPALFNVSVNRTYYDKLEIPLGTVLVVLLGICVSLDWKFNRGVFVRRVKYSALAGVLAFLLSFFATKLLVASVGAGIFAFSLIPHVATLKKADVKNPRKLGGYVAHIGLLLLFIGVMGSWIYEEHYQNVRLEVGSTTKVGNYEFVLKDIHFREDPEKFEAIAKIEVYENGRLVAVLEPTQKVYKLTREDRVVSGVAIETTPLKDYYVALSSVGRDFVFVELYVVPLVSFVWLGSIAMIVGGVISARKEV